MEEKIRTFRKGGGLSCRICCWGGIYHLCAVRCGFHGPGFSYGGGILGVSEKAAGISFKLLTDPISCTTLSMEAAQEAFS